MSKFGAENGRLQTHQPRKWNSHYRAEPDQSRESFVFFSCFLTLPLQEHQLISPRLYHGRTKREVCQNLPYYSIYYSLILVIIIIYYPYLLQPNLNSSPTPGGVKPLRRGRGRPRAPAHRGLGWWEHWARCPRRPQPQQGPHTGVLYGEISPWGAFAWARLLGWHILAAG